VLKSINSDFVRSVKYYWMKGSMPKCSGCENGSYTNRNNMKNVKRETSRTIRNKEKEYYIYI
jgi:hypothetical protein